MRRQGVILGAAVLALGAWTYVAGERSASRAASLGTDNARLSAELLALRGRLRSATTDRPEERELPRIWSVERAAEFLDLTDAQLISIAAVVAHTRDDIRYLYGTPNAAGLDWHQATKRAARIGTSSTVRNDEEFRITYEFKRTIVPGSHESYGDAERRIKTSGLEALRALLTPEQATAWDGAIKFQIFSVPRY